MINTNVPGYPKGTPLAVTPAAHRLINGTEIAVAYEDLPVAASQSLEINTPVSLDADGAVVEAAPGTPAIGITAWPVETTALGETKTVSVIRAGVLNPDALNWPLGFATREAKLAAFRGAPAPTNIVVKPSV